MRQNRPTMVLNLPAHTQKQLAHMAVSPAPAPSPAATPMEQYRAALAQRYRQQIQGILTTDEQALMEDPDAITPAPITIARASTIITATAVSDEFDTDADEEELLPPYSEEEEGNASDCTITVQEIDSPDTPTDEDSAEPRFFPSIFSSTSSATSPSALERVTSTSSEPTAVVNGVAGTTLRVEFEPKPLSRARPLSTGSPCAAAATKAGVTSIITEKACLRPRSASRGSAKSERPKLSPRSSKVRKQLAALFGKHQHHQHHHQNAAKPAIIRTTGLV